MSSGRVKFAAAIDNCAVSPCKNEARCVDGLNDFTCECRRGFSGETCEIGNVKCTVA